MLYEFISLNRDTIVRRARDRGRSRPWPAVSGRELEHGVPLFLTQLAETLRLEERRRRLRAMRLALPPRATAPNC